MNSRPDYFWLFFKPSGRLGQRAYLFASLLIFAIQLFLSYRFVMEVQGVVPGTDPLTPDQIIVTPAGETYFLIFTASVLVGAWCNIVLAIKRLHDFGKPGTLAFLFLFVSYLLVLILVFFKGDPGPNRYGSQSDSPS